MLSSVAAAAGLQTSNNNINSPPGGALIADDVVCRRPGIYESRPGLIPLAQFPGSYFALYNQYLISAHGTNGKMYSVYGGVVNSTPFSQIGSATTDPGLVVSRSTTSRIFHHVSASNKNFYYLTTKGPYKISYDLPFQTLVTSIPAASAPIRAGTPRGLDGQAVTSGASGWLNNNSNAAYQIVFGYTDQTGNLILGAPSEIFSVSNSSGGTRTADITFSLPRGLTTSYFYQIYRSDQTNDATVTAGINFQFAGQASLTSGNISAGAITVTDSLPDASRGAFLYTDATQDGPLATNDPPPLCQDIAEWNGMMFYMNPSLPFSTTINLATVGGSGLVNDDIVYIVNGSDSSNTKFDYTGKASQNDASHQFAVVTGGTATANIIATAKNLVECINHDLRTNARVHARYIGDSGSPGSIYLEMDSLYQLFGVYSTRSGAFNPAIGLTSTTVNTIATGANIRNGIYISKVGIPEAVPLTNLIFVGQGGKAIVRGFGLLDAFYVITESGVFRITGDTPSTLTIRLLYPDVSPAIIGGLGDDSHCVLDGSIYMSSTQGILVINGSGKTNISVPVSAKISQPGMAFVNPNTKEYLINVTAEDTIHSRVMVYNYITGAWTEWVPQGDDVIFGLYDTVTAQMFYINQHSVLMTDNPLAGLSPFSFDGFIFAGSAVGAVADVLQTTDTTGVSNGDLIYSVANRTYTTVVNVNDGTHLKVSPAVAWSSGELYIVKLTAPKVQYTPSHGGSPNYLKHWSTLEYDLSANGAITLGVASDLSQTEATVSFTPTLTTLAPVRILTPIEQARAHWLLLSLSSSGATVNWGLHGASAEFQVTSTRMR